MTQYLEGLTSPPLFNNGGGGGGGLGRGVSGAPLRPPLGLFSGRMEWAAGRRVLGDESGLFCVFSRMAVRGTSVFGLNGLRAGYGSIWIEKLWAIPAFYFLE